MLNPYLTQILQNLQTESLKYLKAWGETTECECEQVDLHRHWKLLVVEQLRLQGDSLQGEIQTSVIALVYGEADREVYDWIGLECVQYAVQNSVRIVFQFQSVFLWVDFEFVDRKSENVEVLASQLQVFAGCIIFVWDFVKLVKNIVLNAHSHFKRKISEEVFLNFFWEIEVVLENQDGLVEKVRHHFIPVALYLLAMLPNILRYLMPNLIILLLQLTITLDLTPSSKWGLWFLYILIYQRPRLNLPRQSSLISNLAVAGIIDLLNQVSRRFKINQV